MQLVTRMQMLNKGCGVISWRLRGQLGALPIDIDFQSTFELDLITGRVRAIIRAAFQITLTYPALAPGSWSAYAGQARRYMGCRSLSAMRS